MPVQNGGIALFRGRTVTVPSVAPTTTIQHGKVDEGKAAASNASPNSLMPAPLVFDYNKTLVHENPVVNTRVVIAPQSTPDGRVIPMPLHPSVITPHTSTTTLIEQFESSEDGFNSTPTDRYPESPNVGNALQTMGPPPNRHSTTVTPTENNITNQASTQNAVHMATKLFANEGPPFTSEKRSDAAAGPKQTFIANEVSMEMNGRANIDNTNEIDDGDREDFHQRHQQFVTMIRDLHDMDKKFQDMMFDGSLHIDVATALLLEMKCETYAVTDQILEQLHCANVALREFLPQGMEQE
jgi:hypothetical protein